MSEALYFASTNPQYDDRLFIELQVKYIKIPISNLWRSCCVQKLFLTFRTIFVHNMFSQCSELGIFPYWTCNSMNNMSSYCGLLDAKIRASDKDLPVQRYLDTGKGNSYATYGSKTFGWIWRVGIFYQTGWWFFMRWKWDWTRNFKPLPTTTL